MKLMKLLKFRKNAEILTRRNEILKRTKAVEAILDEDLPCKKKYNATSEDVNEFMAKQICKCTVETIGGTLQCQYGCSCNYFRKTCSLDCGCEGMCIPNTFFHLPDLEVRIGIAGDELYTKEDIDLGQLAFVFTGEMTSLEKYHKSIKKDQVDLYTITGRWKGGGLYNIGKDGVPTFVINTYKEESGFANHSCDPNIEVFEIWQNGKLYIVGKTTKYCFASDSLTYDYNWEWRDDAKYSEICLCGSKNCRAFVAKVSSIVMKRSIWRYETILNEMETHNIYETQKIERLKMALHTNLPLTLKEKMDVEHLKQDSEELRLTKRKAMYLKKGILLAKAKLAQVEISENAHKEIFLGEAQYSSYQRLPKECSTKVELDYPHGESIKIIESKIAKFASPSPSNLALPNSNDEVGFDIHRFKSNDPHFHSKSIESKFANPSCRDLALPDSDDEEDSTSVASKASSHSYASALSKNSLNATPVKNPNEHCVSESRISQALKNDGLPLSVRIPLPLKDNDDCVLMGVQDVNKLLIESKLKLESSDESRSFFKMPKCASTSCFYPPQLPTSSKSRSINTPYLNQYNLAMKTNHTNEVNEELNEFYPTENVGIKKARREKRKITTSKITNLGDKIKNAEDWGDGLFTQDEINRIFGWIDGTIHARGEGSQVQPWPKAKEWAFWLHKKFRHPTPIELQNHKKTWVGMSTNTLRASDSGKATTSRTLPLVRDVKTLLSDVLTFVPFRFSGFNLVESTKLGNIWCIVWNKIGEPLPGNPTFRTCG